MWDFLPRQWVEFYPLQKGQLLVTSWWWQPGFVHVFYISAQSEHFDRGRRSTFTHYDKVNFWTARDDEDMVLYMCFKFQPHPSNLTMTVGQLLPIMIRSSFNYLVMMTTWFCTYVPNFSSNWAVWQIRGWPFTPGGNDITWSLRDDEEPVLYTCFKFQLNLSCCPF